IARFGSGCLCEFPGMFRPLLSVFWLNFEFCGDKDHRRLPPYRTVMCIWSPSDGSPDTHSVAWLSTLIKRLIMGAYKNFSISSTCTKGIGCFVSLMPSLYVFSRSFYSDKLIRRLTYRLVPETRDKTA